jgi:hypothetical protein
LSHTPIALLLCLAACCRTPLHITRHCTPHTILHRTPLHTTYHCTPHTIAHHTPFYTAHHCTSHTIAPCIPLHPAHQMAFLDLRMELRLRELVGVERGRSSRRQCTRQQPQRARTRLVAARAHDTPPPLLFLAGQRIFHRRLMRCGYNRDTALRVGRFLGGVRRCDFFGAGNTWAPQVQLPPKFHSCERDFNALSGWGAPGSRVPRLREPFMYYLVARRVVLRCFL